MIRTYWQQTVAFLKNHQRTFFLLAGGILIIIAGLLIYITQGRSQNIKDITPSSEFINAGGKTVFSLTTKQTHLYKSKSKSGRDTAFEFIKENPKINDSETILPEDFFTNTSVTREIHDVDDPFLRKNNIVLNNEHYFFDQKLDGIPVYNATVVVHVRNGNEVYATSGSISTDKTKTEEKISEAEGIQAALKQAQSESGASSLKVVNSAKYYFNEKLIGLSEDSTNKIILRVEIENPGTPVLFKTDYFVSLTDGKILYSETQTRDALDRKVYDCPGGSCSLSRTEGSSPSGSSEADKLYTYFGDVYNFYESAFGRDSYDGNGATFNGYVNTPTGFSVSGATMKCPNAFWSGYEMVFCTGLVLPDVTGHELTHAVTSRTAGLQYLRQSGAINEGISDIFGSEIDKNWDIGEGVKPGMGLPVPLRSMSNPPSRGDPDKLSSSIYACGTSDNGGVHKNSGVMNKTYYLMVDGGSFNGCSINGIGRDKSIKIVYQALTKYLTPNSNYKDVYTTFLQSCGDLYGGGSAECDNIDRAMQATELDQQATGVSVSPVCQGIAMKAATCAASGGAPSVPPTTAPTGSTIPTVPPGAPTPTPVVASSGTSKLSVTPMCEGGKQQLRIDYDISTTFGWVFETINSAGNPSGIEDMSYLQGVFGSPATGKGTYIARGNYSGGILSTPVGLKKSYKYTVEAHLADPGTTNSLILTLSVTTADCSIPTPVPTSPGGSSTTGSPTPIPTPRQFFTCLPDPKCVQEKKSLHLCPLVCQPVAGSTIPTPTSGGTIPTKVPGTSPTVTIPTSSLSPTSVSTPTTTTTPGNTVDIASVIGRISENNLREYMTQLVTDSDVSTPNELQSRWSSYDGQAGRPKGNKTEAEYIKSVFDGIGLATNYQLFPVSYATATVSTNNVVGRLVGENPNSVYLITSHMDSRGDSYGTGNTHAPGADDNASGTVMVMEAAKVLKESGVKLKNTIEFVAFSGEEQGLFGSEYYARNIPSGKQIKGVFNGDMIGNKSGGDCSEFLYLRGGLGSNLSSKVVEANLVYGIGLSVTSKEANESDPGNVITRSDQWPFLARGIPATFGMECVFSPVYHSPDDKMNLINFSQIKKVTAAVVAAVLMLDSQ